MKLRPERKKAQTEYLPVTEQDWAKLRAETRQQFPAELAGRDLPAVLLTYQQRLLATTAAHQVTVVEKSRRIGFTWAVGADAVLHSAASRQAGGMDCFYIGYNLEMAREFIDTCAMWARAFKHLASTVQEYVFKEQDEEGKEREIKAFRITFASGFAIIALPSRPRSLRGMQGYVIIDEAAFHDDLPALLKAAMALLMWGGKVLVISTHDSAENAFNLLIEDIRKGRLPYALLTVTFDDALKDGLYERICLVKGRTWSAAAEAKWRSEIIAYYGGDADEELHVIPSQSGGAYLPAWLLDRAQREGIPVIRWTQGPDFTLASEATRQSETDAFFDEKIAPLLKVESATGLRSAIGFDVARLVDLSVIWPIFITADRRNLPPFVMEMKGIPFDCQARLLYRIIDTLRQVTRLSRVCIDGTGLGFQIAEQAQQKYGAELVERVAFTADYYATNLPLWKAAYEDGIIIMPRDDATYRDHRAVKVKGGKTTIIREGGRSTKGEDGKGGDGAKDGARHGDSAVANFLAFMASRADAIVFDHLSGPPTQTYNDFTSGMSGPMTGGGIDLGGFLP